MKKSHPVFLTLVAVSFLAGRMFAQEAGEKLTPPSGALLKLAPDYSKWTVNYIYAQASDPKTPLTGTETHQVNMTKTRTIISEDIVDGMGRHDSIWHVGPLQYRKPPEQTIWFESSAARGNVEVHSDFRPLPANGFRGWDWVGEETYVGTLPLGTVSCLVFAPEGAKGIKGALTKEQVAALTTVAFVNVETRLPVMMRVGNVTQQFVFAPPPTAMQELPTDLKEQIKQAEQARQRLYQPAPRPY